MVRLKKRRGGQLSNSSPTLSNVESYSDTWMARKLDKVLKDLIPLAERGKVTRFLNSAEDVDRLWGLAEDIRDAMMDYQVCAQNSHTGCT